MTDTSGLRREDFSHAYQVMSDVLSTVHAQVNFAEAKNGALLAANLATIVGVSAILIADGLTLVSVRWWLSITLCGLALGGLIALSSFLPIMGNERHDYSLGNDAPKNLVFWGDIATTSPLSYATAMLTALEIASVPAKLHLDLADQIVVNSGIASRKFGRFRVAALVTGAAVVLPALILGSCWVGWGGRFA